MGLRYQCQHYCYVNITLYFFFLSLPWISTLNTEKHYVLSELSVSNVESFASFNVK